MVIWISCKGPSEVNMMVIVIANTIPIKGYPNKYKGNLMEIFMIN